ncbi:MAG TPA: hypothetical protein QF517_02315 [Pseudomonadales bacterium]|nr:hypothetical protein [Gammaproteobacteria bacterium]MDP6026290.1 hypothetical protein [Pseudomonadales bacterium]MDP7451354.1 hypothetical protein [Arenicellales bacterium]MDP7314075.1 hypothetical protein [Pseudomonadales bacterium]MDP7576882.1 hypothetical protein [Pseudomonadales bacterium]
MRIRSRFYRPATGSDAFTDLLFNALLGFAFMFFVAFMLMAKPDQTGKIDSKAEFIITVSWPDFHPDDIDVLVEDPRGQVLWFENKDTEVMHLDRDDRGSFHDQLIIDGQKISNPINQETVSLRAWVPGEYVVNVLHYKANYKEPVPVTVKIEKLNPEISLVYYGVHELNRIGMEVTAARFVLDNSGQPKSVNSLQKSLLSRLGPKAG